MKYNCKIDNVCAKVVSFEIEDGKVHNIEFFGGCPGNAKALAKILDGIEATKVIELLKGNECRNKGTSCADQLAKAIEEKIGE